MMCITLITILLLLTNYDCKPTKDFLSSLDKQSETPTAEIATNEKDQQTLNTDLGLSLPITQDVGLIKAQKHLIRMKKKDPIRYKEFRERRQKSSIKYRTKNSAIDPLSEKGKLLKANKAASRSKAYFKARQKYGITALKHRFEVEQLREKIKKGVGTVEDVKKVEQADEKRKEGVRVKNHKYYLSKKAKDKKKDI